MAIPNKTPYTYHRLHKQIKGIGVQDKEEIRSREFDEEWKKVLEKFFWDFLDFYFPEIAKQINKTKGYTFLDQEMVKIFREAESKKRRVDKLAKVYLQDGEEIWLLIHVEIQTYHDTEFALRMFTYHYRIFERYQKPVASLAILADPSPGFRPSSFEIKAFGKTFTHFEFPIVKFLDWEGKEDLLENDQNIFSIVTLASLKTFQKDHHQRYTWKWHLTRMLYERGYSHQTILALYEFLDGIMTLPEELEEEYSQRLAEYEEKENMPYITTAERVGIRREKKQDILDALEARFGNIPEKIAPQVNSIMDLDRLRFLLTKSDCCIRCSGICRSSPRINEKPRQ